MKQSQRRVIKGARKIAVLRASGLGDFLFALPAFEALRHTYPEAEIVLLGRPWHRTFLEGRPGPIDRVLELPSIAGLTESEGPLLPERDLEAFVARMQGEEFHLAIQMHGGGRYSNPFLRRLGAQYTLGCRSEDAAALDFWLPYVFYQHETFRCLEIVGLVGASASSFYPRLTVCPHDYGEAVRALGPWGKTTRLGKALVVLNPGARDPRRRWPVEKFAQLADALVAEAGVSIIINGSEDEGELAADLAAGMTHQALNLCGQLSLRGLAGLLARSALMISNDSGPLHLALAVGCSGLGLYWCGNMINYQPLLRAHHRPHISWRLACSECGHPYGRAPACGHTSSMLDEVPLEEVKHSALQLLGKRKQRS